MKNHTRHSAAATLLFALVIFAAPVEANTVIEWNQLAGPHIAGPPFAQARQWAMLHVAMADAVVAIEGRYEPFHVAEPGPRGASANAAAAQAAHDVLLSFFSSATPAGAAAIAAFDAKLAADLATVPPGDLGAEVGRKIAAAVIAWRATDGFAAANPLPPAFPPALLPSVLPGIWIPTASGPAQFSKLGDVEPFGVLTSTQFLPDPPPQLESAEYAADFNEVKWGERPVPYPTSCDDPSIEGRKRIALVWALTAPCQSVTSPQSRVA